MKFLEIDDVVYADEQELRDALDVKKRLSALAALQPGWLDGEGEDLDRDGLAWVSTVLASVVDDGLRPYLYPTLGGGVLAVWAFPDAAVSAEFDLEDRTAELVGTHIRSNAMRDEVVDFSQHGATTRLLEFVTSFGPEGLGART